MVKYPSPTLRHRNECKTGEQSVTPFSALPLSYGLISEPDGIRTRVPS